MGLLKAVVGAVGSVLADQWKEYYYCDALDTDIIVKKACKRVSARTANHNGSNHIISNGSIIAVSDGQCMIIVDQGRVTEVCAEPGEYIYDSSTQTSIFYGKLDGQAIKKVFSEISKRFGFGGDIATDQRIYYFNTKEFTGNCYGTPAPVPFRVVDENIGLDLDITIRCFGEYSYRITNPLLFYMNVCGNVENTYKREKIDEQLKSELLTSLQPAFAEISKQGIRYSALPGHTVDLTNSLNRILSDKWKELRGIEIASLGISSIKAGEKDEEIIKELQRNAVFRNPSMAAAQLVNAQAVAMQEASKNSYSGAAMAFMNMNMVNQIGGINAQYLYELEKNKNIQEIENQQINGSWQCECGNIATGKFCSVCGKQRQNIEIWICQCGTKNQGWFCTSCGLKKPDKKRLYCSNCGWSLNDNIEKINYCPKCGERL